MEIQHNNNDGGDGDGDGTHEAIFLDSLAPRLKSTYLDCLQLQCEIIPSGSQEVCVLDDSGDVSGESNRPYPVSAACATFDQTSCRVFGSTVDSGFVFLSSL